MLFELPAREAEDYRDCDWRTQVQWLPGLGPTERATDRHHHASRRPRSDSEPLTMTIGPRASRPI